PHARLSMIFIRKSVPTFRAHALTARPHTELAVGAAAFVGVGGPAGADRPLERAGPEACDVEPGAELMVVVGGAEGLDLGADIEGVKSGQARRDPHVKARPYRRQRCVGRDHRCGGRLIPKLETGARAVVVAAQSR